jgi:hypothetical protein
MTYNNGQASRRRKRRERLPVDILGQHRPEEVLIWLVGAHRHCPRLGEPFEPILLYQ